MDFNSGQMKWLRKEYDIVPNSDGDETNLIPDTQILTKFPSCYNFSLSTIDSFAYIIGNANPPYPIFYHLDLNNMELSKELNQEGLEKTINSTFIHSTFVCNNRIYILSNICKQNFDSLVIYDPVSGKFYPIKGDTHPTTFRINYTVNEYEGLAYLFGGLNDHCEPLDSMEALDITTYRWCTIETHGEIPPPRHSHVSCLVKNMLYIFGGTNEVSFNDPAPLTDMYVLDLTTMMWIQLSPIGSIPKGNTIAMGIIRENTLILLWSDNEEVKISIYCITTNEWKEINIEGAKPSRRYGAAGLITKEKVMLFGGFSETEYSDIAYCDVLEIKGSGNNSGKK